MPISCSLLQLSVPQAAKAPCSMEKKLGCPSHEPALLLLTSDSWFFTSDILLRTSAIWVLSLFSIFKSGGTRHMAWCLRSSRSLREYDDASPKGRVELNRSVNCSQTKMGIFNSPHSSTFCPTVDTRDEMLSFVHLQPCNLGYYYGTTKEQHISILWGRA